jgi:23S rRNA (cytosine1962-C5)-methyltransferase
MGEENALRTVVLRPGRGKPLWWGHPWVFADSVLRVDDGEGDLVRVADSEGRTIGRGWLSPASAIRVRMLDRGEGATSEDDLLARRVDEAAALRRRLFPDPARTDAYRLVHGEADGLPGVVVDRYGPVLSAQFSTRPSLARRERLAALLLAKSGARSLLARPGGKELEEGIEPEEVPFTAGEPVPEAVDVVEEGLRLRVDLRGGQKTGAYLDQRENRVAVAEVARGGTVLDLYAGTAGFSLHALRAGAARATAVDSSEAALATAREDARRNALDERLETVAGDVVLRLEALRDARETFDVVVLDPPRFAARRAGLVRALAAYRDRNARAIARVARGGFLATFSCSGLVDAAAFAEVVRSAARDGARDAVVLRTLEAGPDHPVGLAAPEGRYLAGLLLRVS